MDKKVFGSIIGYDVVKDELLRILDQLNNYEKYEAFGVDEPHGLLFHGVPGVGKSSFAMDFLKASGRKSYICRKDKSNVDFIKNIVSIFDEAMKTAPSIILLDDLDKYANSNENCKNNEEFITVQTCIDRVKDSKVFIVATVNDIEKLPESLIRAGRFDYIVELDCPTGKDAYNIVEHYLSRKSFIADMDLRRIGRLLEGRSCAELETVINKAGAYAAFDGREQVEMKDMIKSILRLIFNAPESYGKDLKTLPLVACHEAGHALVAELLEPNSVDLVTILNHESNSAGVTLITKDECYFYSKEMMENRVMYLLAGKAATEIMYGVVDTGTNSDLRRAFNIVHRFVDCFCSYGFNQFLIDDNSSNETRERRDSRIAAEMDHYFAKVKQIIVKNKNKLQLLANKLIEEKTLLGDEVQNIINLE